MTTPDPGQKHERLRIGDALVLLDSLPTPIEVEVVGIRGGVVEVRVVAPRDIEIAVRRAGEAS